MPLHLEIGAEPVPGYRLIRPLGQGGFGVVWEAEAPGGVRVALKFIALGTAQAGPELRALEVIRNIRHPHLLDVQFAVRREDHLVIAMPLCERSLKDRLRDCQDEGLDGLPRDELLGYMDEVARAVDYLNEPRHPGGDGRLVGIQHRDIKPHNIFLVGGSARLADFGLAKVVEATRPEHSGALSPPYAAPEVLQGRVSGRSDQYSLAATYFHLRTGRPLFQGSVNEVIAGHLFRDPDLSDLPEGERAVLGRALAKDPEERWPSCREFVRQLERAAREETEEDSMASRTKTLVPPTTRPGRRARPRRRWLRSAAGVGIAVALAGLAAVVAHIVPRDHSTMPPASIVPKAVPADSTRPEGGRPSAANRGPGGSSAPTSPVEPPPASPARPVARAATPTPTPARLDATDPGLAQRAYGLLKRYCYSCHGSTFKVPGYNVLDRDGLVAAPPAGKKRKKAYVVPGAADASLVWQRVGIDEDMPPEDHPIPSDEEKAVLKRWIEAGAPFPVLATPRPFVGEKDVLTAIRDHLETVPADDQPFQRYVTLTHLHNNRKVLDDDLRLYRAALAKLVNSLSWKPRIVLPRAIDRHETVYAIDLRELGWDEGDLWRALVRREDPPTGTKFLGARDEERKGYPYGLTHHRDRDEDVRRLAQEVSRRTGCELPYLRADWLIATASRPPLYETILGLSRDARDLERRLGVDVLGDFLSDRLARAGFATSGVSHHNRMLERHDQGTSGGAYWKSYDFKSDEGTAGLLRFPLGPAFDGNPFERQAFEHAGGEIIFHLPNKLQGYLLVNARDERIEAGPIEIVGDALQTSGTATIVNGLSCMGCHKNGMIGGFEDTIRAGNALAGEPRAKVERLYLPKAAMDRLVAGDEEEFLAALEKATGPFLRVGDEKDKPIRDFPEPIGAIARLYVKDLGLEEVAAELGFAEPKELQARIEANPALRLLGLGPLLQPGGRIKRAAWESLKFFNTPFQEAALQLELGTPYHEL